MEKFFCRMPFTGISISSDGNIYPSCCKEWVSLPLGNIRKNSFQEIWNSSAAHKLRSSSLDGSLRYCSQTLCPFLVAATQDEPNAHVFKHSTLPEALIETVTRKAYENGGVFVAEPPKVVTITYDRSCNLRCPSCRSDFLKLTPDEEENLRIIHDRVTKEILPLAEIITLGGEGDPLGSNFLRNFLFNLDLKNFPRLKAIGIQTNAQLLTPALWQKMKGLHHLNQIYFDISIDAASPSIYEIVRPPGKWGTLMENLEFIKSIPNLGGFMLSFVVQDRNIHQILEFVELGRKLSQTGKNVPTRIFFSQFQNWGQLTEEEAQEQQVQNPAHPRHDELLKVLKELKKKIKKEIEANSSLHIEHNFSAKLFPSG